MGNHSKRLVLACVVACAGTAISQEAKKPLLSGPDVKDARPALVEDSFGEKGMGKARLGALDAIPAQDLREIMRAMNAPESDPSLRLSEEQAVRVRELMREFEVERRAYMQEHREELMELQKASGIRVDQPERGANRDDRRERVESTEQDMREPVAPEGVRRQARPRVDRQAPEGRRPGAADALKPDAKVDAKPTAEQEAARLKLREFMQAGPSTGDLQRRIYAELSPEQQGFIDGEVLRLAEERAQDRDMAQLERKRQDRAQQAPGARPGTAAPAGGNRERIDWSKVYNEDGSVNVEALPERVRQRLENLNEQDRKKAVEALKKRFETGQRLRSGD